MLKRIRRFVEMSAIGPKRTFQSCESMSAFGGRADIFEGKADITRTNERTCVGPDLYGVSFFEQ
jgi:hypothetical protein